MLVQKDVKISGFNITCLTEANPSVRANDSNDSSLSLRTKRILTPSRVHASLYVSVPNLFTLGSVHHSNMPTLIFVPEIEGKFRVNF